MDEMCNGLKCEFLKLSFSCYVQFDKGGGGISGLL